MLNFEESHVIEECAELIEVLALIQFEVTKKKRGWEKRIRALMEKFKEETRDVAKTVNRLNL